MHYSPVLMKAPISSSHNKIVFCASKNLITTIAFLFKKNLHRIVYVPFEKRKNDTFPLALLKSSWKCYFNARECLMGFSTNTVKI